ncbi:MAG: anti-sigma factor [Planctomycetia bacterium]|nr:anti-sigma factor [Planctomycetia bacterium]
MNCADCERLLPEFASGGLAPAESADVRRHLATECQQCNAEHERWRESFSLFALATPLEAPPSGLRSALLDRVRADAANMTDGGRIAVAQPLPSGRRINWRAFIPYAAATLCAVLAGVAAVRLADHQVANQAALEQDFQRRMADAQKLFPTAELRRASLGKVGGHGEVDGQLVFDSVAGEVHFYADNLGFPATDSHFELWLVDAADHWTSIAYLQPAADGSCSALLRAPAGLTEIVRAVVTEEPDRVVMDAAARKPVGPERMVADFGAGAAD